MPPPSDLPIVNPDPPGDGKPLPSLPVLPVDATHRTQAEKYGGLYYLGIAGLIVLVALVGWFAYGIWSHRDVWARIYVLHDRSRPEAERIQAALALGGDPRVNQRQYWDICVRDVGLPALARYLIAEALTAEAASADSRGYALTVARSEGWPNWLRLLLLRPLAYRAAEGGSIAPGPLAELRGHPDPMIGLWAAFAQAASAADGAAARQVLQREAQGDGPGRELARLLLEALAAEGAARIRALDRATLWLRRHHPEAARLWAGWAVQGDRLVPEPAPDLLQAPPGPPRTTSSPAAAGR
jgi:hypothetical protein